MAACPIHVNWICPATNRFPTGRPSCAALAEGESCIENFQVVWRHPPAAGCPEPDGRAMAVGRTQPDHSGARYGRFAAPGQAPSLRQFGHHPAFAGRSFGRGRHTCGFGWLAGIVPPSMERIVHPLQRMGVPIHAAPGECAPLTLAARPMQQHLRNIQYTLPVASAHVKSCLLLAALAADGPSTCLNPAPRATTLKTCWAAWE